jgi:hypothetical protein
MDADGQHDPACVPDLLKALQDADFVLGSRFLGECRYKIPIARRIGMWLFGKIVNWVTGQKITDPTSGFQALRKEVVKFLAEDNYPVVSRMPMSSSCFTGQGSASKKFPSSCTSASTASPCTRI